MCCAWIHGRSNDSEKPSNSSEDVCGSSAYGVWAGSDYESLRACQRRDRSDGDPEADSTEETLLATRI